MYPSQDSSQKASQHFETLRVYCYKKSLGRELEGPLKRTQSHPGPNLRARTLKTVIHHSGRCWQKQNSRSEAKAIQTLKLFSLGLRLMMMLKVSYGSSLLLWILLVMSCWYWFGSSHTRNVLTSPRSLGFGSGPKPKYQGLFIITMK